MEEELKSLKASVTSYKSANTKQRTIIEEQKKKIAELAEYAHEADLMNEEKAEKIGVLANELDAAIKDYATIKEVNNELKASLDRNVEENNELRHSLEVLQKELDKVRDARDQAMQESIKNRLDKKPWWKKIF
jgi:chromosome segregation ATPase